MKKQQSNNTQNSKKPTFLIDTIEAEDNLSCIFDLPLFIATSKEREVMNKAIIKAKAIEKSLT